MQGWARYSHEVIRRPQGVAANARYFLRSSYLSVAGLSCRFIRTPGLRCLFCHNIFDDQVESFRRICRTLAQMGKFVDACTCLDMLQGKTPIDGTYYHLSFDDGFHNILDNALPILQEFSIPAAIFVVTGFVGASYEAVAQYCATHWSSYAAPIEMLSWSDLAELQRLGITIGSHSHTHARFSLLQTRSQLVNEITVSKQELEQRLGAECRYISWPYGRLSDASQESLAFVQEAGYSGCFGGHRGRVRPGVTNPFSIPRHHFEPNWPVSHVRFFASGNSE